MKIVLVCLEIAVLVVVWALTFAAFANVDNAAWSPFGIPAASAAYLLSRGGMLVGMLGMVHLAWPRLKA